MTEMAERILAAAERYAEPGARWLPDVPMVNSELRWNLHRAFLAGADYALAQVEISESQQSQPKK